PDHPCRAGTSYALERLGDVFHLSLTPSPRRAEAGVGRDLLPPRSPGGPRQLYDSRRIGARHRYTAGLWTGYPPDAAARYRCTVALGSPYSVIRALMGVPAAFLARSSASWAGVSLNRPPRGRSVSVAIAVPVSVSISDTKVSAVESPLGSC